MTTYSKPYKSISIGRPFNKGWLGGLLPFSQICNPVCSNQFIGCWTACLSAYRLSATVSGQVWKPTTAEFDIFRDINTCNSGLSIWFSKRGSLTLRWFQNTKSGIEWPNYSVYQSELNYVVIFWQTHKERLRDTKLPASFNWRSCFFMITRWN